jgi:hypothetical protein
MVKTFRNHLRLQNITGIFTAVTSEIGLYYLLGLYAVLFGTQVPEFRGNMLLQFSE